MDKEAENTKNYDESDHPGETAESQRSVQSSVVDTV